MKKTSVYILVCSLFVATIILILIKAKNAEIKTENTFYTLKDRNRVLAATPGWISIQEKASKLYQKLNDKPEDKKTLLALAALFIQEARTTGDYAYYDKAALHQVNKVLKQDANDFEALTLKALIYLSQHHFADGLQTAKKIEEINPYSAFNYGILVDASVELGNYNSAIAYADKMISIRPDIRSYSRISYLREIHGDYPGAIEAMKEAVTAGFPGDEGTEWARVQLGHLYENTGDFKNAEMQYLIALDELPGYAFASAGLGRIAMARNDFKKAESYFIKANSSISDQSFKEELITCYKKMNEPERAALVLQNLIQEMNKNTQAGKDDENIGHYSDRELAIAYTTAGEYDKALEHALAEFNRRPDNIDVNETVAWVYYKRNDIIKANQYINSALKTGSKNPTLLCKAGLIASKSNEQDKAKKLFMEAFSRNPYIEANVREEALKNFASIK